MVRDSAWVPGFDPAWPSSRVPRGLPSSSDSVSNCDNPSASTIREVVLWSVIHVVREDVLMDITVVRALLLCVWRLRRTWRACSSHSFFFSPFLAPLVVVEVFQFMPPLMVEPQILQTMVAVRSIGLAGAGVGRSCALDLENVDCQLPLV
ncbi:hypothetical protein Tco_0528757 [Tanacetum coccineum]